MLSSPSIRCLKHRFLSSSNFASTRPQAIQQQARSSRRIDPVTPPALLNGAEACIKNFKVTGN